MIRASIISENGIQRNKDRDEKGMSWNKDRDERGMSWSLRTYYKDRDEKVCRIWESEL